MQTFFNVISPRYLETLSIPLTLGRQFSDHDGAAAPPVAIVNETLARRIWPNDNPAGRRCVVGLLRPRAAFGEDGPAGGAAL